MKYYSNCHYWRSQGWRSYNTDASLEKLTLMLEKTFCYILKLKYEDEAPDLNLHSYAYGFTCSSPDATHPHNHTAMDILLALWLLGVSEAEVLPLARFE